MRLESSALVAVTAIACVLFTARADAGDYPRLAPYPAIRWSDETPEVQIEDTWYVLVAINGLVMEEVVAFAKKQYEDKWQKRIDEDLVEVLMTLDHAPGPTVKLALRDLKTGARKYLDQPMTEENRKSIMKFKQSQNLRPALDAFRAALNDQWSYRHANDADFDSALAALRKRVDAGITLSDFGVELQKIIALGIDGHAVVEGHELESRGHLPFLVEPAAGGRFVAFEPDRRAFLADGFPFVSKIDGRPLAEWLKAASVVVPKGSPQYVTRNCLRVLRDLDYVRRSLGLTEKDDVEVELSARDGSGTKTVTRRVADKTPGYGKWPDTRSALVEGNIGYLRLMDMHADASIPEIKEWMPRFRDTDGLIIDVRDNGGGDRDALLLLYSYLTVPSDPPRVINAAAYRLHKEHKENHLAQRFMYRADAREWIKEERQAIATFAKAFKPKWKLPKGQFSDWHYLVLSRMSDANIDHYTKPVIVLLNAKCFSATDIFLAGLKGLKNVTLLGGPSGGGSALAGEVALGDTPFRLRLGSMASFQSDGRLFDGNGVEPDVIVEPVPEYFIGGEDNVLAEALKRLQK